MKRTYKRLTHEDRIVIEKLLSLGYSQVFISVEIGCHKSSICREVKRFSNKKYVATKATHLAVSNSSNRRFGKCKIIHQERLRKYVLDKLEDRWSPEQIHLYLKKNYSHNSEMQISMESIYFYIYVHAKPELKKLLISYLRQKRSYRGNVRRGMDKRTTIKDAVRIDERPKEVGLRIIPGHWESDLIKGKDNKSAIVTVNERSSRMVFLLQLDKFDSESVREALEKLFWPLPKHMKKSLTHDNGSEMAQHKLFTKNTKVQVYFTHPYSPWERPTNENSNGLIRDYFPKGTDFNLITKAQLKKVQNQLNERPRKVLGMCTPKEMFKKFILDKI